MGKAGQLPGYDGNVAVCVRVNVCGRACACACACARGRRGRLAPPLHLETMERVHPEARVHGPQFPGPAESYTPTGTLSSPSSVYVIVGNAEKLSDADDVVIDRLHKTLHMDAIVVQDTVCHKPTHAAAPPQSVRVESGGEGDASFTRPSLGFRGAGRMMVRKFSRFGCTAEIIRLCALSFWVPL